MRPRITKIRIIWPSTHQWTIDRKPHYNSINELVTTDHYWGFTLGYQCGCQFNWLKWTSSHQLRMRPFKPFWGWTKNTSSSFFSVSSLLKSFSLLLTSPHFVFIPSSKLEAGATIIRGQECLKREPPSSELRSTWKGSQHCQSLRVLEVGATIIKA